MNHMQGCGPEFKVQGARNYVSSESQCFVCDSVICGRSIPLLMGIAPYSKIALPTKIGQLMGDGFMVIVTAEDVLCHRCSSLIIRLDKLEVDTDTVKKALTGYMKMKYNLYEEENESHLLDYSYMCGTEEEVPNGPDSEDQLIFQAFKGIQAIGSEDEGSDPHANIKQEEIDEKDGLDVTGYKCVSCQYKTTSSAIFMEHLKIHSKEMYFKCSNCNEEFHNHCEIQDHIKNVHHSQSQRNRTDDVTGRIPHTFYECNICKFQSPDRTLFDIHVSKHDRAQFYKCSVCNKQLKSKTLLKKHMNSHRVFKCGLCNLTFKEKSSLLEHFVQHRISKAVQVKEETQGGADSRDGPEEQVQDSWLNHEQDYDRVEQLLEQLHAEDPTSNPKMRDDKSPQDEDMQGDEQRQAVDSETNVKQHHSESEDAFGEVQNEMNEATFLLENSVLGQDDDDEYDDDDDNLSADMDKNDDSETNDFLNDPSDYLEDFQQSSKEQKENEGTNKHKSEGVVNVPGDGSADNSKNLSTMSLKKRVYVCSICGLRTYTENHMKRHFKSHVAIEKKIYECHICNKVLTTRSNLNRHLSNHENCPGIVMCKLCNEELTDRLHLKQHLEDQHTGPQHCSFCNMEFTSKRAFKEHELTHPERAIHQCGICHKRFLTQLRLRVHMENIHDRPKDGDAEEKTFKCHICSKILTTYHNLKRHVRNHEKSSGSVKCTLCSEELTDKLHLRQHVEETHPETHQCPFCQKVFSNKKVCKAHELSHPERYVYKCDMCDKMFLNETRLEKHKTVFHRDPHCQYCEKEIKDPTKLFNHERRHEMYKNKFPCQQCPKVFRTPSGLKYHTSIHTGKYAVYCEICGKGMHSEIVLEEHKATHTKEIRYTCELCGRNFSSNSTYRMHRKWHDNPLPYKCKICDRKFKHTSILAVHMRRAHTGERPYKCPHCPYTFSVSSTLHKHIILHTKKYPHNCKLCGKGFTTRTKIARHMAKAHNDFDMLNAKPTPCQYKMVLKPSELSSADSELKQEEQLPEPKFEERNLEPGQTIFLFQ
ncbi:zinc finger protein 62-like isoform X2 [Zootermopsis nevadensis]|uniref:zinc finger protein 62-like isoform X2 n=1 Tax=Zootermopsis nevadensis TaxID=136037 RepID=UPI000B8E9623|nr:zinc finger protein 62-like isoform X2 [Zootermopsis nevadensis]